MIPAPAGIAAVLLAFALQSGLATAQIAVSANDGKARLVDGKVQIVKDGIDTVSVIDLAPATPRLLGEVQAPASVVGPPTSVAIVPSEEIAIVTSAMKIDPANSERQIPDDRISVIDLKKGAGAPGVIARTRARVTGAPLPSATPEVIATLQVGKGPSGVAINKAGTLALVANRNDGTVSVLAIEGKKVSVVGEKIKLGDERSGPSAVAFLPDGKSALVTRDGDHRISVLSVEGTKVVYTGTDMYAGLRPSSLDISAKGDYAIVANVGMGAGDADTLSLIDLSRKPQRIVQTTSVGQSPEGVRISPDGQFVAVVVNNGTVKPRTSPHFNDNAFLLILRRAGTTLTRVTEVPIGRWCQGIVWTPNGKKLLVQCMVEREIIVFNFGKTVTRAGSLQMKSGPAAIQTAVK